MYSNSVVKASGQIWKFCIATAVIWAGITLSIFSILGNIYFVLFGLLIGFSGIAFCCIAIRCPVCGERWYWKAIKKRAKVGWVKKLIYQSECQSCGYSLTHMSRFQVNSHKKIFRPNIWPKLNHTQRSITSSVMVAVKSSLTANTYRGSLIAVSPLPVSFLNPLSMTGSLDIHRLT